MKTSLLILTIGLMSIYSTNSLFAQSDNKKTISLTIDSNTIYTSWKNLSMPLEFKNISSKTQSFSYWHPHFWYPTIIDVTTGQQIQVMGEIYDGPVQKKTIDLNPDESVRIDSWPIMGIVQYAKLVMDTPSKYKVYFEIRVEINKKEQVLTSNTIVIMVGG